MGKYDSLTKEERLRLMEARDRREATRYGLVWEADGVEAEQVLNGDYVALQLALIGSRRWPSILNFSELLTGLLNISR